MLTAEQYKKAITRNLYELAHARLEWQALNSFDCYLEHREIYYSGENFFRISVRALRYCMVGHAIKVLDRNKNSATFWAILDSAPDRIKKLSSYGEERGGTLINWRASLKAFVMRHISISTKMER